MGNHFRTSGAGDDAPKTQTGVQGSRFATPDSEGQPVAQVPAQPADPDDPAGITALFARSEGTNR